MDNLKVHRLITGPFQTNTYIVEVHGNCFIVDPGEEEPVIEKILSMECNPAAIIATHAHFDHIIGVRAIRRKFDIPFLMHRGDLPILRIQPIFVKQVWGFELPTLVEKPDRLIEEGDRLNSAMEVIHTPGHSPGSITLSGNGFLIVGDVIFKDGYGRTDLPGGDETQLFKSIKRILSYPGETIVYPGHGPETTVEYLRKVIHWL